MADFSVGLWLGELGTLAEIRLSARDGCAFCGSLRLAECKRDLPCAGRRSFFER